MREMSEGFRQQLWDLSVAQVATLAAGFDKLCQSPIEIDFAVAFFMSVDLNANEPVWMVPADSKMPSTPAYYLRPQFQIGKHRVDFVAGSTWGTVEAIIECDGREFHHSTRLQIERDRARDKELEALGYTVFRFPGAEIHATPFNCVATVLRWLLDKNGLPKSE